MACDARVLAHESFQYEVALMNHPPSWMLQSLHFFRGMGVCSTHHIKPPFKSPIPLQLTTKTSTPLQPPHHQAPHRRLVAFCRVHSELSDWEGHPIESDFFAPQAQDHTRSPTDVFQDLIYPDSTLVPMGLGMSRVSIPDRF